MPLVFNTQPTKSGLHTFPLRRQIACQLASGRNYFNYSPGIPGGRFYNGIAFRQLLPTAKNGRNIDNTVTICAIASIRNRISAPSLQITNYSISSI